MCPVVSSVFIMNLFGKIGNIPTREASNTISFFSFLFFPPHVLFILLYQVTENKHAVVRPPVRKPLKNILVRKGFLLRHFWIALLQMEEYVHRK